MKKITFGIPEEVIPSKYCQSLQYIETDITYDVQQIQHKKTARGYLLEFPISESEQIYGFGLQLKAFNHKGKKLMLRVNSDPVADTGDSHAPVPFFVSTAGYGMYFDTARYIEVHCGFCKKRMRSSDLQSRELRGTVEALYGREAIQEDRMMSVEIPSALGIDVYIMEGSTILDVVAQYNLLAGGGCQVPDWGLGIFYRAFYKSTDQDIRQLADYFRENDLPCDVIGLEPGWQSASYSCSYVWDKSRFPQPQKTIEYLRDRNFHVNLWEHAYVHPTSPIYEALYPYSGDYEVWNGLVPDFGAEKARDIFAGYHKQLIQMGIDGFKLDECDNSDYKNDWCFPNCAQFDSGMDGEQYHSMFGTLYMQTIQKALDGIPTVSQVRSAGALCAPYPFVLYSDLYDHKDFIRGVVNAGFSGILWAPEVRDCHSSKEFIRRLQTTVFSVQCLVNAWYCEEMPWKGFDCEDQVRELLKVREALLPKLKAAFLLYHTKGIPPVRALVADYTQDPETYFIDDEYVFCGDLIVAPLSYDQDEREVYLPAGKWQDYWTKIPVESGRFRVRTEKIPVYEKV